MGCTGASVDGAPLRSSVTAAELVPPHQPELPQVNQIIIMLEDSNKSPRKTNFSIFFPAILNLEERSAGMVTAVAPTLEPKTTTRPSLVPRLEKKRATATRET